MNELYTKFESFINKEMSVEELIVFEKELDSNPKLKEDYELHRSLQMVVDSQVEAESRQTIEKLKNQPAKDAGLGDDKSLGPRHFRNIFFYGLVILMVIIGFNQGRKAKLDAKSKINTEELFLAYYEAPAIDTDRSGGTREGAADISVNGHKLIGLENYKAAQGKFSVCGSGESIEAKSCQWYEALCALRLDKSSAKKMIEKISKDKENPYREEAKELLSKM